MTFRVVVKYDAVTKSYAAYCPELPGCASAGDTEEESLTNFREAIILYLQPTYVKLKRHEKTFQVEVPA
jgi:predicted RNase H-like HicB family nuclease